MTLTLSTTTGGLYCTATSGVSWPAVRTHNPWPTSRDCTPSAAMRSRKFSRSSLDVISAPCGAGLYGPGPLNVSPLNVARAREPLFRPHLGQHAFRKILSLGHLAKVVLDLLEPPHDF